MESVEYNRLGSVPNPVDRSAIYTRIAGYSVTRSIYLRTILPCTLHWVGSVDEISEFTAMV